MNAILLAAKERKDRKAGAPPSQYGCRAFSRFPFHISCRAGLSRRSPVRGTQAEAGRRRACLAVASAKAGHHSSFIVPFTITQSHSPLFPPVKCIELTPILME
jgi:hypothetical protein